MLNSAYSIQSLRLAATLTIGAVCAALAPSAHAGASQVYGTHFAWNNNFNNSAISASFGSGTTANMTVSYNFPSGNLYGYPACIRGWHYGWNPTGDTLFPKQLSSTATIPCSFSYSSGGSNMSGDFAYDMFLRWDSAKSSPQLEVMVWAGNNSWPIGTQTGTNVISAGGYTFDIWEGMNSAAGYYVYTFIPHGTAGVGSLPTSGSLNVDMKVFFNWLQANRSGSHFSSSMYLDVIEAGIEITGGNGWSWIQGNFNATSGTSGGTTSSYVKLRNAATGLMVDGMGRTTNGSNCGQYASGSSYNQQWTEEAVSGYYKYRNRGTGLYIDGMGRTTNGSIVGQYAGGTSNNQQWAREAAGANVKFRNRATGLYMDGAGSSTNGADLSQWTSSSSTNQQWQMTAP
jgi:hypothetical protein